MCGEKAQNVLEEKWGEKNSTMTVTNIGTNEIPKDKGGGGKVWRNLGSRLEKGQL